MTMSTELWELQSFHSNENSGSIVLSFLGLSLLLFHTIMEQGGLTADDQRLQSAAHNSTERNENLNDKAGSC